MSEPHDSTEALGGFVHVSDVLGDVLKEVHRRAELRARLTAERGRQPIDGEFLAIAEHGGLML